MRDQWMLLSSRICCRLAPLMLLGFAGAGIAHLFFGVGDYPDQGARNAVGALFLGLFCPVTVVIWLLARQRVKRLIALRDGSSAEKKR